MTPYNLVHILITLCFSALFFLPVLMTTGRKDLIKKSVSKESNFILVDNVDGY